MPTRVVQVRLWQIGVAFAAVTGAFVVQGVILSFQGKRNEKAVAALCAQRADLDQRIEATQKLLDQHKGKRTIFAIPRLVIVASQRRDRTTRHNLEILDC